MTQTSTEVSFRYTSLCILTSITGRLHFVQGCSTYWSRLLSSQRCQFSGLELYVIPLVTIKAPNTHCSLFQIRHFALTLITRKIQVLYGNFTYRTTTLLSKMSVSGIELDERYDWQDCYGWTRIAISVPYAIMRPYKHAKLENYRSYIYGRTAYRTTALLLKTFLVWLRIVYIVL